MSATSRPHLGDLFLAAVEQPPIEALTDIVPALALAKGGAD